MRSRQFVRWLCWLTVACSAVVALYRQEPPKVVPATSSPASFSAERALSIVRTIARRPHPMGSPEAERVARWLVSELVALGLDVREGSYPACTELGPFSNCGFAHNVIATLRGSAPHGPAVLFSAHYDSVPSSPGAADDGAGVAGLLETARALTHGPRLPHDIIFSFVDGEEYLCLGAAAWAQEAEFRRVFLAVNFEARGNAGPSVLIDTTPRNSALVRELSVALTAPALNSIYVALAGVLPNGTDAEVYRRQGPSVLSFAIADGLPYYHHGTDTVEALDARSLQHHGVHALDIARHFGSLDPVQIQAATDSVFFDLFGIWVVRYSVRAAQISGLLLGALLLYRSRTLRSLPRLKKQLQGVAILSGILVLGVAFVATWTWLFAKNMSDEASYSHRNLALASSAAALAGALGLSFQVLKKLGTRAPTLPTLQDASLALWLGLSALTVALAPTASHLFVWPAVGMLALRALRKNGREHLAPLAFLPVTLLLPTFVRACFITFGSGATLILAFFSLLVLPWLIPERGPAAERQTRLRLALPVGLLAAAMLIAIAARFQTTPPVGTSVAYVALSPAEALLATSDAAQTSWHQSVFGSAAPRFSNQVPALFPERQRPTAPVDLPRPTITLISDTWNGHERTLKLRLNSARKARELVLEERSGAKFEEIGLEGAHKVELARVSRAVDTQFMRLFGINSFGNTYVAVHAVPPEGATMLARTTSRARLVFRLTDESPGLPEASQALTARPPGTTLGYPGDHTRVVGEPIQVPALPAVPASL